MRRRGLIPAIALCALATRAAVAQSGRGLTVTAGFGYGRANGSCENCLDGSTLGGLTAYAEIAHPLGRSVRIGAMLEGWGHTVDGATEQMANVSATLFYSPRMSGFTGPLFILPGLCFRHCTFTFGAGLAAYRATGLESAAGAGWGLSTGYGYTLPIGHGIALTPNVRYVYGNLGTLKLSGGGGTFATGWKQHFLEMSVGLVFWTHNSVTSR